MRNTPKSFTRFGRHGSRKFEDVESPTDIYLNKALLIIACLICCALHGNCQGQFLFYNGSARTRIGSMDGPLAGRGFRAQMLVGDNLSSLAPVGMPLEHTTNGAVGGIVRVTVPDVPPDTFAYVQMVAWNGVAWGTELSGVPL